MMDPELKRILTDLIASNERLTTSQSYWRAFWRGVVSGVGATVGAAIVIALAASLLHSLAGFRLFKPVVQPLLPYIEHEQQNNRLPAPQYSVESPSPEPTVEASSSSLPSPSATPTISSISE